VGQKQKLNVEVKVRDSPKIAFQHLPITRQSHPLSVVIDVIVDELSEVHPVLAVQAVDMVPINIGQLAGHLRISGERLPLCCKQKWCNAESLRSAFSP
jgi:hypothetical protein